MRTALTRRRVSRFWEQPMASSVVCLEARFKRQHGLKTVAMENRTEGRLDGFTLRRADPDPLQEERCRLGIDFDPVLAGDPRRGALEGREPPPSVVSPECRRRIGLKEEDVFR